MADDAALLRSTLRDVLGLLPRCADPDCREPATHGVGFDATAGKGYFSFIRYAAMCEPHAREWSRRQPGRVVERDGWSADRIERAQRVLAESEARDG